MLSDERSTRFLNDFSGQWLEVRNISSQQPAQQFQFDPTLREAMARETELFFQSQVRDDRPIQDLLRANYTFLNERLAQHYGVEGVFGSHFRRVTLTNEDRFGLLGQGSVLTVTSYNDRTSVVRRGYWILDVLLGAPPPPPPPNVPPLKENDPRGKPAALRERMEQHRNNAGVRELPRADGSARLRARALRRRRPLPSDRRRRPHRFRHRVPRRQR